MGFRILYIVMILTTIATVTLQAKQNQIVIAHRGASGYVPEHTLPAKAMAYAMGARLPSKHEKTEP